MLVELYFPGQLGTLTAGGDRVSYRALDYAVQITQAWVAAAGGEENEDPSNYVAAVSPAAITSVLEAVYRKVVELEGEMMQATGVVQPSWAVQPGYATPSSHLNRTTFGEVPFQP